jgi:hypothetical protein
VVRCGTATSEMRVGFGAPMLCLPYKVGKPPRLMGPGGPCQCWASHHRPIKPSIVGVMYPGYCGPLVMTQQIWIRPSSLQRQTGGEKVSYIRYGPTTPS